MACKVLAGIKKDETYHQAARLLGRVFAVSFVFGVVTGIDMEFQFGTNWARFLALRGRHHRVTRPWKACSRSSSNRRSWGCFCSAKTSIAARMTAAVAVFVGSWLSGYFIVATDA